MGISFPHSDMSGMLLQVVARREIRYQIVCRDRDDVSWQFRDCRRRPSFSFYAYRECVKFWKEKKIFTQARAFHFIGQTYRSAGNVGKFSIYQLVERLMQRNGDDVIAPVALSPVEWLFSEFICPIGENVQAGERFDAFPP